MIKRELIFKGIEEQLRRLLETGAVARFERGLRHIDDVQPEDMPALFMVCANQRVERQAPGGPSKYNLPLQLYVYTSARENEGAQVVLNNVLDAIETIFETTHQHPTTRFGLPGVTSIRIEGEIQTDEGALIDRAAAVVPVSILAAG